MHCLLFLLLHLRKVHLFSYNTVGKLVLVELHSACTKLFLWVWRILWMMNVRFFGTKFYLFSSVHLIDQFKKDIQIQILTKCKKTQEGFWYFFFFKSEAHHDIYAHSGLFPCHPVKCWMPLLNLSWKSPWILLLLGKLNIRRYPRLVAGPVFCESFWSYCINNCYISNFPFSA